MFQKESPVEPTGLFIMSIFKLTNFELQTSNIEILVPVMIWFIRSFNRNAQVICLILC